MKCEWCEKKTNVLVLIPLPDSQGVLKNRPVCLDCAVALGDAKPVEEKQDEAVSRDE